MNSFIRNVDMRSAHADAALPWLSSCEIGHLANALQCRAGLPERSPSPMLQSAGCPLVQLSLTRATLYLSPSVCVDGEAALQAAGCAASSGAGVPGRVLTWIRSRCAMKSLALGGAGRGDQGLRARRWRRARPTSAIIIDSMPLLPIGSVSSGPSSGGVTPMAAARRRGRHHGPASLDRATRRALSNHCRPRPIVACGGQSPIYWLRAHPTQPVTAALADS